MLQVALCWLAGERRPSRPTWPHRASLSDERISLARGVELASLAEEWGVALELRGSARYWGRCPFHAERTASFSISVEHNTYYCFGCGAKGDAISFAREMRPDLADFRDAVSWLATRRQSEVASAQRHASSSMVDVKSAPVSDRELVDCLNEVADFYASVLARPEGRGGLARDYLRSRGISASTARRFGLGLAPSAPGATADAVEASLQTLEACGVVFPRTRRDRFAGRLTLPIRDADGTVLGFGSRSLDGTGPKYVNSPSTRLFCKKDTLFGLNVAAPHIRSADEVIIVEGYFDVLALHQVAVANVVAGLGCALTGAQIERAARFADSRRVVLALDADDAADKAIHRLCNSILPELSERAGLDVRVARFTETAEDAADFVHRRILRNCDSLQIRADFSNLVIDGAQSWTEHVD